MNSVNKFIEKRQMLERIRLVGPQAKSAEVMEALARKGFRLIQSGPYTTKSMFPKVDPDRFLFIAERDI
jgi:hypothetical protein